jgi:3'-5' exonuclease
VKKTFNCLCRPLSAGQKKHKTIIMQSIIPEQLFILDIETASGHADHGHMDEEWKALWAEKVGKALPPETTAEEFYPARAAILAEFAKVICISFGYLRKQDGTYQLRVKSIAGDDEKTVLQEFIDTICRFHNNNNKWCFTGHNIKEFDIPFLCRRMIANNLNIPGCMDFQMMKPWETPMLDTLHLWRFGDHKHYISLKLLAAVLGVPSPKGDINGSMVGEVYWKEKDLQRIVTYCQKDVATVANIILRFKNLPLLSDGQIVIT